MASNKKWIIGGSITLLVLLGASLGTGALIGYYNREDDNRITIHLGNEVYDEAIDLGTDITSDEEKATLLEKQFYSAALYGSFAGTNPSSTDVISPNYIFNQKEGVELDWNLPYIVTKSLTSPEELQDEFIKVKFLSETEDSSVYSFLTGLSSTVNDQALLMQTIATLLKEASEVGEVVDEDGVVIEEGGIPFPSVTGLDVIEGDDFEETRKLIFELLSTDPSYIKDVQKDILVYTYLWQEPSQNAYDYIFTRELVYSSPSIVYSMKIDGEAADLSDTYNNEIKEATEININATTWNGYISDFKGDVLIDDTIDQNDLVEGGMQGYEGIKFGTSAGTNVSSDWTQWDNTWVPDEEATKGTSKTNEGAYTHTDILNSANLYLADEANGSSGEGAAIFDDTSDETDPIFGNRVGERTIYAYSQLYPYVFREVESAVAGGDAEDILGNEKFSLFAKVEGGQYTPATSEDATNYIFDEWFVDKSIQGEIYVAEALVGNNSSLMSNALRYWNDQGFYIELSGSYEDDLASYLPEEILFNE